MENKNDIRKEIKDKNKNLDEEFKISASNSIFEKVESLDVFKRSKNILVYHSLKDEVQTIAFIQKWESKKIIYLPKVIGDNLDILKYNNESELETGSYNIMEPVGDSCPLDDIDLIIVPAVALSRTGQRIGRGKGYYDRLLSNASQVKIGVIFEHQLCKEFKAEPHDIKMDYVITQNEIIKI